MIDFIGLDEAIAALSDLENMDFTETLKRYNNQHYNPIARARYDTAAASTPYAPKSIGTRKPSTGVARGSAEDPGFGIDSTALREDLVALGRGHTRNTLEIFTELVYGGRIEALFATKGTFAPDGVAFFDEDDLNVAADMLIDDLVTKWEP